MTFEELKNQDEGFDTEEQIEETPQEEEEVTEEETEEEETE